jgi:uncharacterized membrane protein
MVVLTPIIAEAGTILLAGLVLYAAIKRYGRKTGFSIILCSLLWTTPIETIGVSSGDYTYRAFAGVLAPNYSGYLFWVGIVPLWVGLGWFIVSLSSFMIFHEVILPRRRALLSALGAGLLALNIDLMIDPTASSNKLWVWKFYGLNLFGVPIYNFAGWFLMIFCFDLIIWHTIISVHPMKPLSFIENKIYSFKSKLTSSVSIRKRISLLAVRMILLEIVVILGLKTISVIFARFPG